MITHEEVVVNIKSPVFEESETRNQTTLTPLKISSVEIGGVELSEYEAVAKSIKFRNAALLQSQLLNFFMENNIMIYPYEKVAAYLDSFIDAEVKKRGITRLRWWWKPLFKTDIGKLESNHLYINGQISMQQYQLEIPYPVLLTVQKIAKQFPEDVYFYASDIETFRGDPFLAVMGEGTDRFIIERWDEPAFRI